MLDDSSSKSILANTNTKWWCTLNGGGRGAGCRAAADGASRDGGDVSGRAGSVPGAGHSRAVVAYPHAVPAPEEHV